MTSPDPRILVTGASGFIARHLVAELTLGGETVQQLRHSDVDLSTNTVALPSSIETIYHFAGQIWGDESLEGAILDNIIKMARNCGAKRIIYASSCSVYGQNQMDCKTDELVETGPFSPYAKGKLKGEEKLKNSGIDATILRYFNPYGPGQFKKMAVPSMIAKAKAGETLEIFGDGEQVRDFIYIQDMVKASIAAQQVGGAFEIFNVGTGAEETINDLAREIVSLTSSTSTIKHLPIPEERQNLEVHYRVADISKLTSMTAWQPETSLTVGLKRLLAETS
jgi:nucleoside-diphosphate-sugar epimerase